MTERGDDELVLKILHTADWHLGLRFPAFDEADELKLTRARLDAIDRILAAAASYSVDAVLCAGDQFDDPDPKPEWWSGLIAAFRRAVPRPVFLLPGNHDPLTPRSVYHASHPFRRELPDWVRVIDRPDFTWELAPDAVLYATPCTSQAGDKDLALALPDRMPGDSRIRIGLVHGQTFDIKGFQTNFPIAEDAAVRRGFDYLAIGDTHGFRNASRNASAPMVYPGAPEPTRFGERDAGNVAVVCFRRHGRPPHIERISVGRWTWREETCTDLASLERMRDSDGLATTVLRLNLDMTVSLAEYERVETILTELKGTTAAHGRAGVLEVKRDHLRLARTGPECFPEDLPDVLKKVIERLQQSNGEKVADRALYHLYKLARQS
jgi:DNA repair exonuclease SbcCD nuclease subunit